MAAIIKMRHIPLLQRYIINNLYKNRRNISTKQNSDTASATATTATSPVVETKTEDKNWISYGFDYQSKEDDTNAHHSSFFGSVTVCLIFGGFMWAYAPDVHMRNWGQREAFLELRRREACGLPVLDPNYIDPKSVRLPSEAELVDVEIKL